ncbi:MAG: transposase [Verrucomicrobia bacterium]|nr:MAG: transposase [Verrucomicrobiota bacterium]
MPRKPRIESSQGLYHVLNRGNYRTSIFESEGAKKSFQQTLFEACEKFSWNLSAYCVMSNHYHLCLGTPQGNLSEGMRWLQATFALRFNRFRRENGHLFQGRFKSLIVEPGKHWRDLVDYIHLNPVRAGMIDGAASGRYPWSSLFDFPKKKSRARFLDCSWMDYDAVLEDSRGGWIRYLNLLAMRASEDPDEIESVDKRMCRGWCIGEEKFKKALAEELSGKKQAPGLEREALAELNSLQWSGLLEACLKVLGKTQNDILRDGKSSGWKKAIASKMRESTSVNSAWLGEKLLMGPGRNVNSMVSYYERGARKKCKSAKTLEGIDLRNP